MVSTIAGKVVSVRVSLILYVSFSLVTSATSCIDRSVLDMSAPSSICSVKTVPPSLPLSSEGAPKTLICPPSMIAYSVAERVSFLQIVGSHEHGDAVVTVEVANVVPHVLPRLNIQPQSRLIQKQHLRVMNKTHRQLQTPTHAARVSFNLPLCCAFKLQKPQ